MNEIIEIPERDTFAITPESLTAIQAIATGKIPKKYLLKHVGKGEKTFTYISHAWCTKVMNDAFPRLWEWEVLGWEVFADGSVIANCRMTIYFPMKNGGMWKQAFAEVGSFDGGGGKMSKSNMVAAAVSRALPRCMLRAFKFALDLYMKEDAAPSLTNEEIWNSLMTRAKKFKKTQAEVVEALKAAGISNSQLVERMEEAWKIVNDLCRPKEEMPD